MTTVLTPPEPAGTDRRPLRILPIAANLLPTEIVELRRGRKVRRRVIAALAAFAVVLGGWYGLARYQTSTAHDALSAAEADAQVVIRQQRAFGEVISVQADSQAIQTQLSSLLTHDLRWSRLLTSLNAAMPDGMAVTGVSGALTATAGTAAAGAGPTSTQLPNTSGRDLVGTLVVTGTATGLNAVAAYLDALGKTAGLGNPTLDGVIAQDDGLHFTLRLDITTSALGGRYTDQGGNGSGEH